MVNFYLVPIKSGEDPPTGTLRDRTCCRITGRVPSSFFPDDVDTLFGKKTVNPVLCGTSGDTSSSCDIPDRERAGIQCTLTHESEIFTAFLKNTRHIVPG